MARPVVSQAAKELYAGLGVLAEQDEATGWQLLLFCEALIASTVGQIHTYVTDRDEQGLPGWAVLLDPDEAPAEVLAWLGQFVGLTFTPEMGETEMREAIKLPEGFERGSLAAIEQVVRRKITGSNVLIDERYQDNAYRLRVRTFAFETPDPDAVEAAIMTQKPVGIVLTYEAVVGQDWADLIADHATWEDVLADYASWTEAMADLP